MQPVTKAIVRNGPVSHCTPSRLTSCQSINFNWTKSGWRRQKPWLQTASDIVTFSATSPTNSSFINISYKVANWGIFTSCCSVFWRNQQEIYAFSFHSIVSGFLSLCFYCSSYLIHLVSCTCRACRQCES